MMNVDSYHIRVLSTTSNGICSTTKLVKALNMSPNTVVKKVNELLENGYVERLDTVKQGGGNPPKVVHPTGEGLKLLELLAKGEFRALHKRYGVLAGPLLTFSRLGITLVGGRDLFAAGPIETPFFDVVVCPPHMFEDAVEDDGLFYPGLESFIVWAIESGNPRFVAMVPLILKEVDGIDFGRLKRLAATRGAAGRLDFLLEVAGLDKHVDAGVKRSRRASRMLDAAVAPDRDMARIADKYDVVGVPDGQSFRDMERLYGGNLRWLPKRRRPT